MVYEADTLRDAIQSAWSLTGHLSKTYNSVTNPYPVQFGTFHRTPSLEEKKSVVVEKINSQVNEKTHELFKELQDQYKLTVKYNVEGIDDTSFDEAESRIEDMEEEVIRILKTLYNPNNQTGIWFSTDFAWAKEDNFEGKPPQFFRILTFTLTRITSFQTTVFHGFGGVLVFKVSGSEGTGLPGSDYTYTEAYNIRPSEGYEIVDEFISAHPDGPGIPIEFAGEFQGDLNFQTYIKKADIGSGFHQLNTIYTLLSNGEQAEVYMLMKSNDTEGVVAQLTETIKLRVRRVERIYVKDQLTGLAISARILKPTAFSIA